MDEAITLEDKQPSSPEPTPPEQKEPEAPKEPEAKVEEQQKDESTPEPAATEPEEKEEPQGAEEQPKPSRSEKRIRQLSARLAEANAPQDPQTPPAPVPPVTPQAPGQVPDLNLPPGDYTPEQIRDHSIRIGQALSSIEVQQLRAELANEKKATQAQQTFRDELSEVESKYPELKEGSPEYDPKLAAVVIDLVEDAIAANPEKVSFAKIANNVMSLQRRTAAASGAAAAAVVASQRDGQAPAPTGSGPKGKAPKEDPFETGFEEGFK